MRFVRKSKNVKYVRTSFSENPTFESHSPKTSKREQRPKLAETCEKQKHKPKYEILKRGNQCKLLIQGTTQNLLWRLERVMSGGGHLVRRNQASFVRCARKKKEILRISSH